MNENNFENGSQGITQLDENGNPLKNRFGMKLAFAVLEILSCLLCNPITMVLGIVALVLTCVANSNYKRGEVKDFKSNAKVSAILLWIGLAFDVVIVIIWIAVFSSREFKEYTDFYQAYMDELRNGGNTDESEDADGAEDVDDTEWDLDWEDVEDDTEYVWDTSDYVAANEDKMGEYWKFTLEGNTIELPCKVSDLLDAGYVFGEQDFTTGEVELKDISDEKLETGDYIEEAFFDPDGTVMLGTVEIYNFTDEEITYGEGTVVSVCLFNDLAYDGEYYTELALSGGISFDSTRDQLVEAWGDSSYRDEESDYDEWMVDPDVSDNYIYVSFGEEGEIMDIYIGYAGEYTIE